MTTQIVMASTLFAAAGAAAAVDDGALGNPDRRLLLVVNSAPTPELTPALDEIPGAEAVLDRFDGVVRLNDLVAPAHPHSWSPRGADEPLIERLLRSYWGIGDDDVELVLESIAVPPGRWLAAVFVDARIRVHADGLMTFGPTRTEVPYRVAGRITELCYLDLVPGLRPVLLTEHGVPSRPVRASAMRTVFEKIAAESAPTRLERNGGVWGGPGRETAVVIGQYLSALGLLTRDEECDLHSRMIVDAARRGATRVAFKPHPSAPPALLDPLYETARNEGVELTVLDDDRPVEVLIALEPPRLVVACFSTALMTARTVFDVEISIVGAAEMLKILRPFPNSNRIPTTIIDAVGRSDGRFHDVTDLQRLVDAVSYAMQPERVQHLRPRAVDVLAELEATDRDRYFAGAALDRLELPGATTTVGTLVRRVVDRAGIRDRLFRADLKMSGRLSRTARRWRLWPSP